MDRYTIIEGEAVEWQDIAEALELDKLVYDEEYYVSLEQCMEWYERNNKIYTMIRDNHSGKIIAYVNISPVTEEYYEKIKSGTFIDTYLPADAIVSYDLPDIYDVYFSSIVVHPDYQNSIIFQKLFMAITEKFNKLGKEEILVKRMVADAVSDKGVKFCKLFGMKQVVNSSHESKIYEVTMLPPEFRISSTPTKELFDYYNLKYKELSQYERENVVEKDNIGAQSRLNVSIEENPVFISYSSKDKEQAQLVCEYLESIGIPCWIAPRNIKPGENYPTQIVAAIRKCSALILLASEGSNESGHVSNEVSIAFDNRKKIIPFKLYDIAFTDEYIYFLGRKHWIDASYDFGEGLDTLGETLSKYLNQSMQGVKNNESKPLNNIDKRTTYNRKQHSEEIVLKEKNSNKTEVVEKYNSTELTRETIVAEINNRMQKFSYCLVDRLKNKEERAEFEKLAIRMFKHSLKLYRHGRLFDAMEDPISQLVQCILEGSDNSGIAVHGLPGSAKNMLLQLAYFRLSDDFVEGKTNILPYYISVNHFEKLSYSDGDVVTQMKEKLGEEVAPFLEFLSQHPEVKPVVFIDAVREHVIGMAVVEKVLGEVLKPLKRYKRVVSIDVGLIKNRIRLKKIISVAGDKSGWLFKTEQVDVGDKENAIEFISCIIKMYRNDDITPEEVYSTIVKLKYSSIDICLVRMIIQELDSTYEMNNISAVEMYEKMALRELNGDEEALAKMSEEMYEYAYNNELVLSPTVYRGKQWSMIHKHHTYLEFLLAYHFASKISSWENAGNNGFFRISLNSSECSFLVELLEANYVLQEKMFNFIMTNFDSFDIRQKANAFYWLGRLTGKGLISEVVSFLEKHFDELKKKTKGNNHETQENYDNHFLFRAVCTGLLFQGKADIMDEYLCMVITNDIANAINRGATIEFYGEQHQESTSDKDYYLDTDKKIGSKTLKELYRRIEKTLYDRSGKYVESNLITALTILQARVQANEENTIPDLRNLVERVIDYVGVYKKRPQHIKSKKIEFYWQSIVDDLLDFMDSSRFNISEKIYNTYSGIRDIKRKQWVSHSIDDPESVSEHTMSAMIMAMFFLPDTMEDNAYSKREIMDMLLIHDLAEAELGDQLMPLDEPTSDLKIQNSVMRKLFVKGTYPEVANMTNYYNIWTGYYNGINLNAKIARDINLIQTVYTFCEYYTKYPTKFKKEEIKEWLNYQGKLTTDIGYSIWNQLITNNSIYDYLQDVLME